MHKWHNLSLVSMSYSKLLMALWLKPNRLTLWLALTGPWVRCFHQLMLHNSYSKSRSLKDLGRVLWITEMINLCYRGRLRSILCFLKEPRRLIRGQMKILYLICRAHKHWRIGHKLFRWQLEMQGPTSQISLRIPHHSQFSSPRIFKKLCRTLS